MFVMLLEPGWVEHLRHHVGSAHRTVCQSLSSKDWHVDISCGTATLAGELSDRWAFSWTLAGELSDRRAFLLMAGRRAFLLNTGRKAFHLNIGRRIFLLKINWQGSFSLEHWQESLSSEYWQQSFFSLLYFIFYYACAISVTLSPTTSPNLAFVYTKPCLAFSHP